MEPGDACTDMDTQCTNLQVQLAQVWDLHCYKVDPYILETAQTQYQVKVQDHEEEVLHHGLCGDYATEISGANVLAGVL